MFETPRRSAIKMIVWRPNCKLLQNADNPLKYKTNFRGNPQLVPSLQQFASGFATKPPQMRRVEQTFLDTATFYPQLATTFPCGAALILPFYETNRSARRGPRR
jgi:hypothetical protein